MPNDSFRFKQFLVRQDLCAMKVGTDGTLLGAWARGGERILDVGTGTGLIALMMAQRFPQAQVTGIDIDEAAVRQSVINVGSSPFAQRITILQQACQAMQGTFDAIVSNPPYFEQSLECPDEQRTLARHTASLSYRELMQSASRMLDETGEFSLVIPADCKQRLESEASLAGFFKSRECAVRTTPRKAPRRYLLAFRKHAPEAVEQTEGVIELAPRQRAPWYQQLTHDFYL
jgi:tRNA1Val (adenine37-N6)-methyltransferase